MSWNARVRCVKSMNLDLTLGKIYVVNNGRFTDDRGYVFGNTVSFTDVNHLNSTLASQFELVEEATDNNVGNITKSIDKALIHEYICHGLTETYKRKNNDYGDSFAKLRKEFDNAILIRIYDKYSRLKTLKGGTKQKVSDESIKDTLIDLANYCIMELVELEVENDVHS